jgi:hypothetical protein
LKNGAACFFAPFPVKLLLRRHLLAPGVGPIRHRGLERV